jgi:hypothetical protein
MPNLSSHEATSPTLTSSSSSSANPTNEPAALVIRWPAAASVASRAAFPTTASKITAVVASAPYGWPAQGKAHVEVEESEPLVP